MGDLGSGHWDVIVKNVQTCRIAVDYCYFFDFIGLKKEMNLELSSGPYPQTALSRSCLALDKHGLYRPVKTLAEPPDQIPRNST